MLFLPERTIEIAKTIEEKYPISLWNSKQWSCGFLMAVFALLLSAGTHFDSDLMVLSGITGATLSVVFISYLFYIELRFVFGETNELLPSTNGD